MNELGFIGAFLIGLTSSVHCIGMCGGIVLGLTYGSAQDVKRPAYRLVYQLLYSTGRVAMYGLAGGLAAWLGGVASSGFRETGHLILVVLAALLLIGMGLYLGGWFPRFASVEKLGRPLWQRLQPLAKKLMPIQSPGQALFAGMVWGWLPCGLVYSTLMLAATAASPITGAGIMLAFGVGTVPAVVGAGLFSQLLQQGLRNPVLRKISGLLLMTIAVTYLLMSWDSLTGVPQTHHH